MKKIYFLAPVVIAVLVAGAFTYRGLMRRPAEEMILPDFKEMGEGPRAPTTALFGLEVGRSSFEDVQALATKLDLKCRDTSARALMKMMREQKKAEAAKAKLEGKVDAVSSASGKKKSPMEKNPQIRYSCEDTKSSQMTDRSRPEAVGRLLVVIDSEDHPVRHASFRRNHTSPVSAWRDATDTLGVLTARYGAPALIKRPLPDAPSDDAFPRYTQTRYEWSFADLKVLLNVMGTPRGIDVHEAVEVPWPVRSDAPQLIGQVASKQLDR